MIQSKAEQRQQEEPASHYNKILSKAKLNLHTNDEQLGARCLTQRPPGTKPPTTRVRYRT